MSKLRNAYRYYRSIGKPAHDALWRARGEVAAMLPERYGPKHGIIYNPAASLFGERHCRWVEKAGEGLRFVGYADDLCRSIQHRGWFTSEFQDETYRGVVYQLPARNGVPRYACGYADPFNDGAAFLSFDPCDDATDAAIGADRIAERAAEEEREYQEAVQARYRADELEAGLMANRATIRALIREMKAAKRAGLADFRTICTRLREDIAQLREESRDAYREIGELSAVYSSHDGWLNA